MNFKAERIEANYFKDWESHAFGYGYGSGEEHIIPKVKQFLSMCCENKRQYDYRKMEKEIGTTITWLLINRFCNYDVGMIEYGTSPRFGWLQPHAERLRDFIVRHTDEQLLGFLRHDENDYFCSPKHCNCGPNGYDEKRTCPNPFFARKS